MFRNYFAHCRQKFIINLSDMISPVSKSMELEKGEIVVYQPDDIIRLEVQVNDDTVWLTQSQMSELFQTSSQNITIHIRNIYAEGELLRQATCKDNLQVHTEGSRRVRRNLKLYNLDVIISVGYRVKSIRGTQFRQWANNVLKDYLIRGYALNHRFAAIEETILKHGKILDDHERKIDLFVRTSLPPVEGVLSLKDLGKKLFAFSRMSISVNKLFKEL